MFRGYVPFCIAWSRIEWTPRFVHINFIFVFKILPKTEFMFKFWSKLSESNIRQTLNTCQVINYTNICSYQSKTSVDCLGYVWGIKWLEIIQRTICDVRNTKKYSRCAPGEVTLTQNLSRVCSLRYKQHWLYLEPGRELVPKLPWIVSAVLQQFRSRDPCSSLAIPWCCMVPGKNKKTGTVLVTFLKDAW